MRLLFFPIPVCSTWESVRVWAAPAKEFEVNHLLLYNRQPAHSQQVTHRGCFQLHKSMQKVHGGVTFLRCVIPAWLCLQQDSNKHLCTCRCFNLFWQSSFTYIKVWEWVLFFRCVCRHTYRAWILACSSCVRTGFLKMSLHGSHRNILDLEW